MNTFLLFALVIFASVYLSKCDHLSVGDMNHHRTLLHHSTEEYKAIPFTRREKQFFYSSPEQRIIKSLLAYDNFHSKATASVSAGGVGHTFVNLRFQSERGVGLSYDVGIYG